MYGNEAAAGAGGALAVTGLSTGSMILSAVAIFLIVSGLVMIVIRRRRLKGRRP